MTRRATSKHWNFTPRILPTLGNRHWSLVSGLWSRVSGRLTSAAGYHLSSIHPPTPRFPGSPAPRLPVPPSLLLSLALALLLSVSSATARVFWTGTGGETSGALAPDASWSRGYATMVKINGGRAGVEVWSASFSLEEAMENLRAKFNLNGAAIWFNGSGEMVWAIATDGERVFRFLLSAGFGPRSTHVFQITQTFDEFKASLETPRTHLFKHAPAFPGSEPKSFLASEKTGTELASASSGASAQEVQEFYGTQLRTSGWASPFAAGKSSGFFIKGNEAILVSTQTTGDSGGCQIMLLHKTLAVVEGK